MKPDNWCQRRAGPKFGGQVGSRDYGAERCRPNSEQVLEQISQLPTNQGRALARGGATAFAPGLT